MGWTNLHNQSQAPRGLDRESRTVPGMEQSFNKDGTRVDHSQQPTEVLSVEGTRVTGALQPTRRLGGAKVLFKLVPRGGNKNKDFTSKKRYYL